MQVNKQIVLSRHLTVFAIGLAVSTALLALAYLMFRQFGFEDKLNYIDREALVSWRYQEFNPKRYFKLFYNLSLIIIPVSTIFLAIPLRSLIKKDIKISLSFLPSLYSWQKKLSAKIKRYERIASFINKNHLSIAVLLLIVVLFNFGYLLETGIWINYYHHNFIIAPINDLFAGKHLLVDSFSQYGMLLPLFLYQIFRWLIPFSYMNLYFVFMVGTIVYYLVTYFFLLALTKNKLLSLFGLFIIMGVQTLFNYPVYPVSENYVWPGATVLRYFFDIPVFFLLYKNKNLHSTPLFTVTCLLTAFAVLYNLETGLALSIGLLSLIFFASFAKPFELIKDKTFLFTYRLTIFIFSLILSFSTFSIYTKIVSGFWPNWSLYTKFITLAQEGISNIDTPLLGWHLPILTIYFLSIIFALHQMIVTKKTLSYLNIIIAGLASYGLVLFNYYISRSVSSNLTVVCLPVLIILIVLVNKLSKSKDKGIRLFRTMVLTTFLIMSITSLHFLVKRLQYRLYSYNHVQELKKYPGNKAFYVVSYNEDEGRTVEELFAAVEGIRELTKGQKKILLFSRFDSVLLIMAEKTHLLPVPMLEQFYYQEELNSAKKTLISLSSKPKYMFVDQKYPQFPPPSSFSGARYLFEALKPFYRYSKTVGILDIYVLRNDL